MFAGWKQSGSQTVKPTTEIVQSIGHLAGESYLFYPWPGLQLPATAPLPFVISAKSLFFFFILSLLIPSYCNRLVIKNLD